MFRFFFKGFDKNRDYLSGFLSIARDASPEKKKIIALCEVINNYSVYLVMATR